MFEGKRIGAILLMGGSGRRFGSDTPKQFHSLGDKPVYTYALDTLRQSRFFDEIVLVCHPSWPCPETGVTIVPGGATRQQSSYEGLKGFTTPPDIVLIHDAVRPFATPDILEANIRGAIAHGAVDTCFPSADTLVYAPEGNKIASIPKREEYLRGQTPQTFRYDWILEAHVRAEKEAISGSSDDCRLLLRLGLPVYIVPGSEHNIKITSEFDLQIAEQILRDKLSEAVYDRLV